MYKQYEANRTQAWHVNKDYYTQQTTGRLKATYRYFGTSKAALQVLIWPIFCSHDLVN